MVKFMHQVAKMVHYVCGKIQSVVLMVYGKWSMFNIDISHVAFFSFSLGDLVLLLLSLWIFVRVHVKASSQLKKKTQ